MLIKHLGGSIKLPTGHCGLYFAKLNPPRLKHD
jgi:hypothetical protein